MYIIAILSFFGWIFVVLFGGVGLFALPIDLINAFRHRPKPRRSSEMKKTKDKMLEAVSGLIKEGEKLRDLDKNNSSNEDAGCFERYKGNREVKNQMNEFKAKYFTLNDEYDLFNQ